VSMQGWQSSQAPALAELVTRVKPKTIIEVGSWRGVSAIWMMQHAPPDAVIYCVDTWLGSIEHMVGEVDPPMPRARGYPTVYDEFRDNILHAGIGNRLYPIPNTSIIGAEFLRRSGVYGDLIYIDASHDADSVWADLCAYRALLTPGGVLCGDDYGAYPGVTQAVDAFAERHGYKAVVVGSLFRLDKMHE